MSLKLAPSVLAADFARLEDQIRVVGEAGADLIHVDVMDGHFVPNLTMGPVVVEALRRSTSLPLDVHLMISEPARYLEAFVRAGADHVTFHCEVVDDPVPLARALREQGVGAGLAVNPETPIERVFDVAPEFDMILVMTVQPGFGGQSFMEENLAKVRALESRFESLESRFDIEVDGGIGLETGPLAAAAGANVQVAGSSVFGQDDPGEAIRALRAAIEPALAR